MMRTLALAVLCMAVLANPMYARTWRIMPDGSGDAPTIQAGLSFSDWGDTVLVAPGTYYGNLQMVSGRILLSEAGPNVTILRPSVGGSIITCVQTMAPTRIQGFTIRNGSDYYGGGIYVQSSQLTIEGNIFKYNTCDAGDGRGGALYVRECALGCLVQGNLFLGNSGYIGGAICSDAGDASIYRANTMIFNSATHAGGFIAYNECNDLFRENLVVANSATWGGGVYVHSSSQCRVQCNDVWNNDPTNYAGTDWTGFGGNISTDPLFCNPAQLDFSLRDDSPCLHTPTCGTMGAFGAGCGAMDIAGNAGESERLLRVEPNPFRDDCRIRLERGSSGPIEIRICDALGRVVRAERSPAAPTGTRQWLWDGKDASGHPVAAGVYFVSIGGAADGESRAIVRLR